MPGKTVCVIGHTESTCNYIAHQLLRFLADYIDVVNWCTGQSLSPPAGYETADIFIISNQTVRESVRDRLATSKPIMIADRIISTEYLDELLDLPQGARAFVVGTTRETVNNTISILHSLGFRYFDLVPYFPGIVGEVPANVDVAITTGLAYLAPRHVKKIIDLGGKGLDLSTFAELLRHLGVPMTVLNDISHYYLEAIVKTTQNTRNVARQNETLMQRLEVMLNTVDEAIVAIDDAGKIVLFNPTAERLLKVQHEQALGKAIRAVLPGVDFSGCLKYGEGIRHKIRQIGDQYFVLNANVIASPTGQVSGLVATFHPVQEVQELETKVRRALSKKGNVARYTFRDIRGTAAELEKALALANRFAQTELTILLEGESGTGKELFAQSIHNHSSRRNGPFIAINFAAIPDNLVESELFGYEDGAFTGARKGGRLGLFEEAHHGTIFLDEIGSASLDVQKRLLRVLEEREVRRLGSSRVAPIDVRVVAATNTELETLVTKGLFRQDLFYRLCSLPIIIPPLRARQSDILALAKHFAEKNYGRKLEIEGRLADFLLGYHWPGNIRELQNVVNYLCHTLAAGQKAGLPDIPKYLLRRLPDGRAPVAPAADSPVAACIPAGLSDPEALRFVRLLLTAIRQHTLNQKGVGWQTLLKQLDGQARVSEHIIKRWLKTLAGMGYIESGVTRQGARITKQGLDLLEHA